MKGLKIASTTLSLLLIMPLTYIKWFILLKYINAPDIVWFLYWFDIPFAILITAINIMIQITNKEDK